MSNLSADRTGESGNYSGRGDPAHARILPSGWELISELKVSSSGREQESH